MAKSLLECDSIRISFGHKTLLSDVFLRCETGDIIGLLGRNGSGKSTLLKIIRGLIPAEDKFVRLNGSCTSSDISNSLVYLNQTSTIPKNFTAREAIVLSTGRSNIDSVIDDPGIEKILSTKVRDLSSGDLRYLEIKIVLSKPAPFVLLDEPFLGVAPVLAEKINQLILDSSVTKGIILTDHNYTNVIDVATQLTLLKDGKLHHLENKNQLRELGYLPS